MRVNRKMTVTDREIPKMKLKLLILAFLVVCTSFASNAATNDDISTTAVANKFVNALQHQRYKEAAALFAQEGLGDISTTEHALKRIDNSLGGFATMHPIATLPAGQSVKLEISSHHNAPLAVQKFVQVRYVSTAVDGKPVFYELNLTADGVAPQILSLALHFPVTDTQSSTRANQFVNTINH